ncbi:hypothetical protein [Cryptosporangium sp. NPDC051539]|uniref:hypothetical protein n=1 Tax=Cryptosporangium sp. NPDC051539 TaxID=3363962 RepID=UPI0037A8CB8C
MNRLTAAMRNAWTSVRDWLTVQDDHSAHDDRAGRHHQHDQTERYSDQPDNTTGRHSARAAAALVSAWADERSHAEREVTDAGEALALATPFARSAEGIRAHEKAQARYDQALERLWFIDGATRAEESAAGTARGEEAASHDADDQADDQADDGEGGDEAGDDQRGRGDAEESQPVDETDGTAGRTDDPVKTARATMDQLRSSGANVRQRWANSAEAYRQQQARWHADDQAAAAAAAADQGWAR